MIPIHEVFQSRGLEDAGHPPFLKSAGTAIGPNGTELSLFCANNCMLQKMKVSPFRPLVALACLLFANPVGGRATGFRFQSQWGRRGFSGANHKKIRRVTRLAARIESEKDRKVFGRIKVPGKTEVVLGTGILDEAAVEIRNAHPKAHRFIVIVDQNVFNAHGEVFLKSFGESLGVQKGDLILIPPGEGSKSREWKANIEDKMLSMLCGRDTVLIAFGGGVVGDLGGFVAATYMRGIPVIQVPTTTMAIVDSSVGGKCAINVPQGKNLLGAFHHPTHVFADLSLTSTLSARLFNEGLAEVIKMGLVASEDLLKLCEDALYEKSKKFQANPRESLGNVKDLIASAIAWAVRLKAEIVTVDSKDTGLRSILNFGHTVGHAIEAESISQESMGLLHGECVAIGMLVELRAAILAFENGDLGEQQLSKDAMNSILPRLKTLLETLDLPTYIPAGIDIDSLIERMAFDKKNKKGEIYIVVLQNIGNAFPNPVRVPTKYLRQAILEFQPKI